jgi:hypothetical protein
MTIHYGAGFEKDFGLRDGEVLSKGQHWRRHLVFGIKVLDDFARTGTGQPVANEAFVLIARPGVPRSPVVHRVDLLSADQVVALVRRREAILADRISPRYAAEAGHCQSCAFRSQCEGAGRPRRS